MQQDPYSSPGNPWPSSASGSAPVVVSAPESPASAPTMLRSPRVDDTWLPPQSREMESGRLHRLLWIFALLTVVLVAPSIIGRVEYSLTAARERARYDVARENLKDLNLNQVSAGYRMIPQLVSPSVVSIRTQHGRSEGQGSGVIVDDAGYIVTNKHVMDGVATADIQLSDGRHGVASIVGVDPLTDIAVLKTEMGDLKAAPWGDSNALEVGDLVWALGSPFGLQKSVTSGILSAKERRGITGEGSRVIQEFLQTDAAVNPGNSGGPLVDINGQVVGINTAIIGPSYQGISFAVPSALARASYEALRKDGYVKRGFLGVEPHLVPDGLARELDLDIGTGVLVHTVSPDTPASEAGLHPGDVILSWNGEKFSDPTLLSRAIAGTEIGSKVPLEVARLVSGEPKQLKLTVRVAPRPKFPQVNEDGD